MFRVIKRAFDLISSLVLFIVISPLFLMLMLMVRIKLGSPVFFKQERSGMNQKSFYMLKFRTMTDERNSDGELLPDEQRITTFGKFLRSTSLDELPELLNIIKGDMSVIGPRPLPTIYNGYYKIDEMQRFLVRGGLIPPDSTEESALISWDEQLACEANYACNLCFKNDLNIFLHVFKMVFRRGETDYGGYVRRALNEEREQVSNELY